MLAWLAKSAFGAFFGKLFGFLQRQREIQRAKKQGANEQSLKNQEKANEQLQLFQEIDGTVSDDDAIAGLSKPRESK